MAAVPRSRVNGCEAEKLTISQKAHSQFYFVLSMYSVNFLSLATPSFDSKKPRLWHNKISLKAGGWEDKTVGPGVITTQCFSTESHCLAQSLTLPSFPSCKASETFSPNVSEVFSSMQQDRAVINTEWDHIHMYHCVYDGYIPANYYDKPEHTGFGTALALVSCRCPS